MEKIIVVVAVLLSLGLSACPEPREVGHAPKKTIDRAQRAVDKAEKQLKQRTEKATKAAAAQE